MDKIREVSCPRWSPYCESLQNLTFSLQHLVWFPNNGHSNDSFWSANNGGTERYRKWRVSKWQPATRLFENLVTFLHLLNGQLAFLFCRPFIQCNGFFLMDMERRQLSSPSRHSIFEKTFSCMENGNLEKENERAAQGKLLKIQISLQLLLLFLISSLILFMMSVSLQLF
jgi:hypothetical protein